MRLYGVLVGLGLACTGCATLSRDLGAALDEETGEYVVPKEETVYRVPVEDAVMMTRRILEEQRYDVMERVDEPMELFTSAHEPGKNPPGTRTFERYFAKGERMGPRQSVVRVFRLKYHEMDDTAEIGVRPAGTRAGELKDADELHPFDFHKDPFKGVGELEKFRFVRGNRDLSIEHTLLERLEMVPSLELVGGNTSVPARSVVLEGWTEAGESTPAPQPECGTPVDGAAPLMARGQTLLLADPLGTRELPSAALRMLCEASAQDVPVVLAVSLPVTEQPLLDTYLASAGASRDAQELLTGSSFWRRVHQDGRSSRAMLWLVEQARRLRASGKAVSLRAFDAEKATGNEREALMAKNLLDARKQHADACMLVLAGGTHVRTASVDWDEDFEPLGVRLAKALPSVRALDVGFTRGTQFSCRESVWEDIECNTFAISPTKEARQSSKVPAGVQLFPAPSKEGFHGRLYVGALNASPPALEPDPGAAVSGLGPRSAP
ncbi:erythromycin esterase family protein [Pyxidicoccus caerfyrddinensis]|uniref:erythromycin esterase family protein n=1 Tax=Pyxidicoccus caerfyrddinensis TaxID=2709663 RepID=UPI0013DA385D|nr:erythromycin esterase family protein [Pyxidicoccus caerfyrddinensis]